MTAVQMDLLAELEEEQAAEHEVAQRAAGDFTWAQDHRALIGCLFCRNVQPAWLLSNNCGWRSRRTRRDRQCTAQWLVSNHVRYYARGLRDRDASVTDTSAAGGKPFDEAQCRVQLEERITRARELRIDVDALLADIENERPAR